MNVQLGKGSDRNNRRYAPGCFVASAAAAAVLAATPALAATQAGSAIANTATLTATTDGGAPQSLRSNTVTLTTAEILDVAIAADRATAETRGGETAAVGFVVTNTGNGQEDYTVVFGSGSSGVAVDRLVIDSDGDGVYTAATDRPLAPGTAVSLAPGQKTRIFVLLDGAQVGAAATITATATARTGSGAPGTVYPAAGDAGGDAVVGATSATASATTQLGPTAGVPMLAKSQSVLSPDGGARAVPGAIVTYRLLASFPTATRGVVIDDAIPAGTTYVAGSLKLDTVSLSDASDGDAGSASASAIRVALGDVPAAASRDIQFSVKIQ
ncbi:hypothetical protein [Sphingomonas echinoides]|uniref:hypothetical protein n=1 Tax=Sphingomonas echinoides TaxID=59803 RepID=UPI00241387E3|nr:hypothetical protein [Sphingomonas echinoides]